MRIVASLVVQNEEHRFLESFLEWNSQWWDELFVYDGGSTDNTVNICSRYASQLAIKPDNVPSFIEHEGKYRSAAFETMVESMRLTEEDWIFSIDADEFLVGAEYKRNLNASLRKLADYANEVNRTSVDIKIPEVWSVDGGRLQIRLDGFWNTMSLPRFFRYRSDWSDKSLRFRNKAMGCGSGPQYTYKNMVRNIRSVSLLHFGYAYDEDKHIKYDRYTSLKNHGHNKKHINSILSDPDLAEWPGVAPKWERG